MSEFVRPRCARWDCIYNHKSVCFCYRVVILEDFKCATFVPKGEYDGLEQV